MGAEVAQVLDAQIAVGGGRFRGIRVSTKWDADEHLTAFGKRLNDDQIVLVRSDVAIADEDKLQFYLEEIYDSNKFDKQDMLTWEKQPVATKTDFELTRQYFEAIIKATNSYEDTNRRHRPVDSQRNQKQQKCQPKHDHREQCNSSPPDEENAEHGCILSFTRFSPSRRRPHQCNLRMEERRAQERSHMDQQAQRKHKLANIQSRRTLPA